MPVVVTEDRIQVVTVGTQGPAGPAGADGPSNITTETETDLAGYLKGDGETVGAVPTIPFSDVTGTLPITQGGTGASTAANAINSLLPTQTSNSGKFLTTNGTVSSWGTVTGTVTSVAVSGSNGIGVSGSPITSSGTITLSLGNITPTTISVTAPNASTVPVTVIGAASQSANLIELKNSSSTTQIVVKPSTLISFPNIGASDLPGFDFNRMSGWSSRLRTDYATGDLVFYNTSSGSEVEAIRFARSTGNITAGRVWASDVVVGTTSTTGVLIGNRYSGGSAVDALQLKTYRNNGADWDTRLTITDGNGSNVAVVKLDNSRLQLNCPSASTVPLTVKAASSQSADLVEIQNSSSVVGLSISPSTLINWPNIGASDLPGFYFIRPSGWSARLRTEYSSGDLVFFNTSSGSEVESCRLVRTGGITTTYLTNTGDTVIGTAGGGVKYITASRYSGGSAVDSLTFRTFNTNGLGYTNRLTLTDGGSNDVGVVRLDNSRLQINCPHASTVPFTVQGAASQTANLVELKNSGGTAIVTVNNAGAVTVGGSGATGGLLVKTGGVQVLDSGFNTFGTLATAYSSATVPLTVQGAASQSANLVELKNSGGTVVVQMTAIGAASFAGSISAAGLEVGTEVGFFGVSAASQQGPLTSADGNTPNSGDATTDTLISNLRTRLNELETILTAYGLLA